MFRTTVLIPVYNESGIIQRMLAAVQEFSAGHPEYFFLFINDGSSDSTGDIIRHAINGSKAMSLIELPANKGKAEALKTGMEKADTELICFTDGDLAYSLDHLLLLTASLEKNDVAIGNRNLGENHLRNVKRKIAGESFNRLVRILLRMPYTDTQAGIKGFRKVAGKNLFRLFRIRDFAFDAELLYIARHKGYSIGLIPARVDESHQHYPSNVSIISDSAGMLWSLVKIIANGIRGRYDE
ncbi:MAG TPA: glycosyltransferase [Bacteroidia bacterium]|nr:glycosyltransferase [Bacteroidia bacterium]